MKAKEIILYLKIIFYIVLIFMSLINFKTVPYFVAGIIILWAFVQKSKRINIKNLTPILAYLGSLVISFLLSEDKALAIKTVERFTALLIIPSLIVSSNFKKKHLEFFKTTMILTTLLVSVLSIIFLVVFVTSNIDFIKSMDSNYLQWKLPKLISVHPTYFGYALTTSLFLALEYVKTEHKRKYIFIGCAFFITVYTVFLSARVAFFLQVLIWSYYLFLFVKKTKRRGLKLASPILLIITFLFVASQSNYFLYKISRGFNEDRFYSWKFALNTVNSKEFVFGQGVGKSKEILKMNWTKEKKLPKNYLSWDFHNQYIKTYFDQGIFGFSTLIFLLIGYPLAKRNRMLLIFCFIITVSMTTESVFGLVSGIVFFSVFYGFFLLERSN